MNDNTTKWAINWLGAIGCLSILGMIVLAVFNVSTDVTSTALIPVTTGVVGAVAGLLAPRGSG